MKGDQLASGGKSATFQGARMQTELESDLKIYGRDFVVAKYDITKEFYFELCRKLKNGEQLPEVLTADEKNAITGAPEPGLQPIAEPIDAPDPRFMPTPAEEFAAVKTWADSPMGLEATEPKPSVGYEGDPVGDNVLVQRVEREHTSNLILPDSLKAKSDLGFIKAVGEAVKYFKRGDLILFDKFASHGADISLIDEDGVERSMLLLREFDILMRLKKIALNG
jgi:co-chaperonin GroES (HSP10)